MTSKPDIVYICDPKRNKRCRKTGCHLNGGPCKYTKDRRYALAGTMPVHLIDLENPTGVKH